MAPSIGKIVGPPGTGKTTEILRLLSAACNKYDHTRIGASSLTKAAVQEMRSRVSRDSGVEGKVNKNIKTMHSHAFNLLGMKKIDVAETHIDEWNEENPEYQLKDGSMKAAAADADENGTAPGVLANPTDQTAKIFRDVALKRLKQIPEEEWFHYERDFFKKWNRWMFQNDYTDYTGMLERVLAESLSPDIDILFVDEAQDMSPLQASIARMWSTTTEATIYAGDYQQAIFRFAGASPEVFLRLAHTWPKNLLQSYRVPKNVLNHARGIITRATDCSFFEYNPREGEDGKYFGDCIDPDLSLEGDHMIISRYRKQSNKWAQWLKEQGIPYKNDFRESEKAWNPCLSQIWTAANTYHRFMSGQNVTGIELTALFKGMKAKNNFTIKKDDIYQQLSPRTEYNLFNIDTVAGVSDTFAYHKRDLEDLLLKKPVAAWDLLSKNWDHDPKAIIDGPKVTVGTIHSVKGGEADNVWIESKVGKGYLKHIANSDNETVNDEIRIAYVAATRARKRLGFVTSTLKRGTRSPFYNIK